MRQVIGRAMDDNYKTPLLTAVIHMAARNISLPANAIFHSDWGGYTPRSAHRPPAHRTAYPTWKITKEAIARYIELRYTRVRLHSALGYRTLQEVHDEFLSQQAVA